MITSEFKTPRAIRNGLNRGVMQIVDDELEVRCSCCLEFFPCDLEFFHYSYKKINRLNNNCKACYVEEKAKRQLCRQIHLKVL